MTPGEHRVRSEVVRTILAWVPGTARSHAIAEGFQDALGVTVSDNYIDQLAAAKKSSLSADRAYDLGEAAAAAGVPWCSGLLLLSVMPPWKPQAWGIAGSLLRRAQHQPDEAEDIRSMWIGVILALAEPWTDLTMRRNAPEHFAPAAFTARQRGVLRKAWATWRADEDSDAFSDVVRAYLAMLAAVNGPPGAPLTTDLVVTKEFKAAVRSAEGQALSWAVRVFEDWDGLPGGRPNTLLDFDEMSFKGPVDLPRASFTLIDPEVLVGQSASTTVPEAVERRIAEATQARLADMRVRAQEMLGNYEPVRDEAVISLDDVL